jgi:hypothetical protein
MNVLLHQFADAVGCMEQPAADLIPNDRWLIEGECDWHLVSSFLLEETRADGTLEVDAAAV